MGPVSLKSMVVRVHVVFKFAHEERLVDTPIVYGQRFSVPSPTVIRRDSHAGGKKLFEAHEIRRILDLVDGKEITLDTDEQTGEPVKVKEKPAPGLRAMILLTLNGGLGNADIASLPLSAVDLETGWLDYPRVKTEIECCIPLWPETVATIQEWIPHGPKANDHDGADLLFLTPFGRPWVRVKERQPEEDGKIRPAVPIDARSPRFKRILKKLGINDRRRLGFYCLRRCTQTFGGEARDPDAVSAIMGHTLSNSMAANYAHRISDERLRAVVDAVRTWLFPPQGHGNWRTRRNERFSGYSVVTTARRCTDAPEQPAGCSLPLPPRQHLVHQVPIAVGGVQREGTAVVVDDRPHPLPVAEQCVLG